MSYRENHKRRLLLTVLTVGALTAACTQPTILGSSDETMPANLTDEPITTTPSDVPPKLDRTISWGKCPDESQSVNECGFLQVPYDYNDPSVGSFKLFLKRKPAADSASAPVNSMAFKELGYT